MHNQKGLSLIEVVAGLVLLGIGILAIASLQVTSVRGNTHSNNVMQATYLAHDRLEWLKHRPFDSGALQPGADQEDVKREIQGVLFAGRYTVTQPTAGGLKTILYTVSWKDRVNHSICIPTSRAR